MKNILTPERRVFIHDYDGVHYPYSAFKTDRFEDVYSFLAIAKVAIAKVHLPDLSPEMAFDMGRRSYRETGDGLGLYLRHLSEVMGVDTAQVRPQLHRDLHIEAYKLIAGNFDHLFAPDANVNTAFERLRGHVNHGLLTQGCVDGWARPLLTLQQRIDYFTQSCLIGFAETNFVTKADSIEPLRLAITSMGAHPEEVVFLEDTLANLKKAKELDPRILTVHIRDTDPHTDYDFVDLSFPTFSAFMEEAVKVYYTPQPAQQHRLTFG